MAAFRRAAQPFAYPTGETTMHRAMSSFGSVWLAFCALFTVGCMAETSDPSELIWYDDEAGACYTEDANGKAVEVPCDGAEPTLEPQGGLLCPTCCPILVEQPWTPVCPD
jgi:hypothetical protein